MIDLIEKVNNVVEKNRKLLSEGARTQRAIFDGHLSKRDLRNKWKEITSQAPEPQTPYDKRLEHFSEMRIKDRKFDSLGDAEDYIFNNADKYDEYVIAVKFEDRDGEEKWMVGTWIPE